MESAESLSISFQHVLAFADTLAIGRTRFLSRLADGMRGSFRAPRMAYRPGDWHLPQAAVPFCATTYEREPIMTVSVPRSAALLSMSEADVTGLIGAGQLFAVLIDNERRIPQWQFTGGGPCSLLPGLEQVLGAAGGMDWRLLSAFMMTPQRDLTMDVALNPIEWSHAGAPETTLISAVENALV